MMLGDGRTVLFWDDRWINGQSVREIAPMLYQCIPKQRRKTRTVVEGLDGNTWARDIQGTIGIHEIGQYLMLRQEIQHFTLSDKHVRLLWRWVASATYTTQFCYAATF